MPTYIDTVLKEKIKKLLVEMAEDCESIDESDTFQTFRAQVLINELETLLKSSLEHFAQMVEKEVIKLKKPLQPPGKPYTTLQGVTYPKDHYNQALDDILSLLTPTTKEE